MGQGRIYNADINASAGVDTTKFANGSVTNTEFQYLDGLTGPIQTQLDAKRGQFSSTPSTTVAAATTTYFFPVGSMIGSTTESNRYLYSSKAGTNSDLFIYTVTTQSATGSMVITWRINAADTAVTLTIAAGSAGGVFSDITHSVAYAKGDRLTIKAVNNAALVASAQINSTSIAN